MKKFAGLLAMFLGAMLVASPNASAQATVTLTATPASGVSFVSGPMGV